MAYGDVRDPRERAGSATLSGAVTLLVGFALFGVGQRPVLPQDAASLDVVMLALKPPPPPEQPDRRPATSRPEGAAAPANRRADPRAVIALPTPLATPDVAPPVAAVGAANNAGAAPLPGPGSGAGGLGSGLGAGQGGSGTGGGGGGSSPRWRSGTIRNGDYPDAASRANAGGTVDVRLTISAEGRVTACSVIRSSGRDDLDATTCRLVQRRFRFHAARNAAGQAVAGDYGWRQRWWLGAAEPASE